MKDCNHPKLQKIKKPYSMTLKCPDCENPIFFMGDHVREILMKEFKSPKSLKSISNNNEIGSLYGIPVFISKMDDEK